MIIGLHAPTGSGIKKAKGRIRKLVLTAENVAEQAELGRLASFVSTHEWPVEAPVADEIVHGVTCEKAPHTREGYMHDENDDTPYTVDGVAYCGRCHFGVN